MKYEEGTEWSDEELEMVFGKIVSQGRVFSLGMVGTEIGEPQEVRWWVLTTFEDGRKVRTHIQKRFVEDVRE